MAEFPSLPLWTDAYLADTRHLSTVEHGAYLLLLMEAWRRPSCSLPDDDALLARLAGLSTSEWNEIKGLVLDFWDYDGRRKEWRQLRLVKEREYLSNQSRSQRDRVLKRWNKRGKTHTGAIPDTIPDGYPADTPTPTPFKEKEPNGSKRKASGSDDADFRGVLQSEMRADILDDFCKHRKAKKAAFTATAAKMFLKNAADCGMSPDKAAVTAIDRNWITVKPEWVSRGGHGGSAPKAKSIGDSFVDLAREIGVLNDGKPDHGSAGLFEAGDAGANGPVLDLDVGTSKQGSGERDSFAGRLLRGA